MQLFWTAVFSVPLLIGGRLLGCEHDPGSADIVYISACGILASEPIAPDGLAVRYSLHTEGASLQLDLAHSEALLHAAERFSKQRVFIQGALTTYAKPEKPGQAVEPSRSSPSLRPIPSDDADTSSSTHSPATPTNGPEYGTVRVDGIRLLKPEQQCAPQQLGFQSVPAPSEVQLYYVSEAETTVLIPSGSAIGRCMIRRQTLEWPKTVLVRLELKGLESFKVQVPQADDRALAVEWCVASSGDFSQRVVLWERGKEVPLDSDSPFYTVVRVASQGRSIPLESGYFLVSIPPQLLKGNPERIELQWIDFYR